MTVGVDDMNKERALFLRKWLAAARVHAARTAQIGAASVVEKPQGRRANPGFLGDLTSSGIVWSATTFDDFFRDPGKMAPDSVMAATVE